MKGSFDDTVWKVTAYEVGMSVPRGVHTEVPQEVIYGQLREELGKVFKALAQRKESEIQEGHFAGPRAHDDFDTAQIRGIPGDWIHQGQERDSHRAQLRREEAQL